MNFPISYIHWIKIPQQEHNENYMIIYYIIIEVVAWCIAVTALGTSIPCSLIDGRWHGGYCTAHVEDLLCHMFN